MLNRRHLLQGSAALVLGSSAALRAVEAAQFKPNFDKLEHRVTDRSAPEVFFIPALTPDAMTRVYHALHWKPVGRVGVKVNFEGKGKPYVDPRLIAPVVKEVKGTFLESNTYSTTRDRLKLAEELGFAAVAPTDIIDDQGTIDLPVKNGYHLKFHRVGSHFKNYDSVISIVRYKLHNLAQLGGTLKNLSITLSPFIGRCNIHSAGRSLTWQESDLETTAESITDAVKGALAARPGRWRSSARCRPSRRKITAAARSMSGTSAFRVARPRGAGRGLHRYHAAECSGQSDPRRLDQGSYAYDPG